MLLLAHPLHANGCARQGASDQRGRLRAERLVVRAEAPVAWPDVPGYDVLGILGRGATFQIWEPAALARRVDAAAQAIMTAAERIERLLTETA